MEASTDSEAPWTSVSTGAMLVALQELAIVPGTISPGLLSRDF